MLKIRIIPILTFNGFGLVKTRQFLNPRMVGNPVQAARVYNSRGVDELVFLDIFASVQKRKINLKLVAEVIKECYMPVAIGGGISTVEDINSLLKIGADKVIIKSKMIENPGFINEASAIFGDQCITLAIDVEQRDGQYFVNNAFGKVIPLENFLREIGKYDFGEVILTSVNNDGMMNGFNIELVRLVEPYIKVPLVVAGGGGEPGHFKELFTETKTDAVGAASIFHFTQFTPDDLKEAVANVGKPVRIVKKASNSMAV